MFLNGYPYTDFHELNLDFLLRSMEELKKAFASFTASNSLIFAEPMLHDLTSTYAKNTIVLDPDGNAYISLQNVPAGIQLSNADYWLMVFNFEEYTEKANKNFTVNYLRDTTRAPQAYAIGDWIVLDDVLYKVTAAIVTDELLVIGTNIVHFTVEQFLKDFVTTVNNTLYQYSLTIQQYKDDIDASELQYKNEIDASELAYRDQLAQDIATTTANLQAQLNLAISGATVDSEVINARLGADGVTYQSLGDNIRTVNTHLFDQLKWFKDDDIYYSGNLLTNTGITDNNYMNPETGAWVANPNYYTTDFIPVAEGETIRLCRNDSVPAARNINAITTFDAWGNLISDTIRNVVDWTVTAGVHYVRISINKDPITLGTGVLLKKINDDWPRMLPKSRDGVLAECVNGLKTAYPLESISYEKNGNDITITCNTRFLLSDDKLTNSIAQTFTMTLDTSITGVAVNKETEQLVQVTPTTIYPSDRFYFIGVWYKRKFIYNPLRLGEKRNDNRTGIIAGKLFAWKAGDKLYLSATAEFRMMFDGAIATSFDNLVINAVHAVQLESNNISTIRYIVFDGSDVHVLSVGNTPAAGVVLMGIIYNNKITSFIDDIIANVMPLQEIVQRENVPTFINYRRLGYEVVPRLQDSNDPNFAYFGNTIRVTNLFDISTGRFPLVVENQFDTSPYNCIFTKNTADISNKQILTVGDSITKRGYYQNVINNYANVNFVGTQTSNYYNIPCEAYSGESMFNVFGSSGPFWNPNTQQLDFNYYCGINNIEPDIVIVLFGLNETVAPYEYIEKMQEFINSVHAHNPNIDVYVIQPIDEAQKAWYGAGAIAFDRFNNYRLYANECQALTDCTLIPAYYILDDETDYSTHEVSYGVGNVTKNVISDGVHPEEATGFKKIGDIVYNYLQ